MLGYAYGEIKPTEEDKFIFNGRRAFCLPERGIPGYVGLISSPPIYVPNNIQLEPEQLDANAINIWKQFRTILEAADSQGRIRYLFDSQGNSISSVSLERLFEQTADGVWYSPPGKPNQLVRHEDLRGVKGSFPNWGQWLMKKLLALKNGNS